MRNGPGIILLLIVGSWLGCQNGELVDKDDVRLARVYKHHLMASDLEGMFADSPTPQDSILMANAFTENWVRETLLMQEAEKNIPKDLDINELVRDYRSSLVKHNYEKLIIELQLDSVITQAQIQQYYDEHKEQYTLEAPLLQLMYLKIPKTGDNLDQVQQWWNEHDDSLNFKKLLDYSNRYADYFILDKSNWVTYNEIKPQLPTNWTEASLTRGKNMKTSDADHLQLIKVNDRLEKGANAPVAAVSAQAKKFILHKRKIQLIEDKKEEMYEREMRLKNIEIYTQ